MEQIRDYKVVNKVGEGGMGSVYLAEDTMLDRKVAIKILNPLLTQDEQFTSRFRQEAKVQASLLHPNIVAMYNFFQEGENYCMVMEYAEGETLKELIRRTGPIPEERALKIFRQMLEGVGYAHSKGIIHRDIKPSNIIVDSRDNVKVMDFGIAKIMGDRGMTKTGMKMGTVLYMSPEQVRAEKDIDQRTDIYSLGITLYEMLTGRVPYNTDTDSDFEIMQEIVSREIKDPREFYPRISEKTANLLKMMTRADKAIRLPDSETCLNMHIDLQKINLLTKTNLSTKNQSTIEKPLSKSSQSYQLGKDLTDQSNIFKRIQGILIKPCVEWKTIKYEQITISELFTNYAMILAAIPAIASFIGQSLVGVSLGPFGSFKLPIVSGILYALLQYILTLLGVYVSAFVVDALAPSFGSPKDMVASLKVVVYSSTAAWIAGIFGIIPTITILGILGLYSLYLFYLGLKIVKDTPEDKIVGYVVVSTIVMIAIYYVIGAIVTAVAMPKLNGFEGLKGF